MQSRATRVRSVVTAVFALALAGAGAAATDTTRTAVGPQAGGAVGIGSLQIESLAAGATPILGFGFEVVAPAAADGSGGGAGKVTVSDVTVLRTPDALSPQLFRAAVFGEHLPGVRIVVFGGARAPEATYVLSDVTIGAYTNSDGVERIAFRFGKVQMGTGGGTPICYDVAQNKVC